MPLFPVGLKASSKMPVGWPALSADCCNRSIEADPGRRNCPVRFPFRFLRSINPAESERFREDSMRKSDQESKLEAQGKFLEMLMGNKMHLLTEKVQ